MQFLRMNSVHYRSFGITYVTTGDPFFLHATQYPPLDTRLFSVSRHAFVCAWKPLQYFIRVFLKKRTVGKAHIKKRGETPDAHILIVCPKLSNYVYGNDRVVCFVSFIIAESLQTLHRAITSGPPMLWA